MSLQARRLIRKMRGGAQAHLIEGTDGAYYVVKFVNNPQHRRILVNEWLATSFLRHLQIHVPDCAVMELTEDFIAESPDLYLSVGTRHEPVVPGLHFASKMAVHPDRVAIFDFLPDKLLAKVENSADFLGTLVFDKWIGNADSRQAVFFRARAKTWTPLKGQVTKTGFFVQMIDHGFAFNGPNWNFQDSPIQGLYFRTSVYEGVQSLDSFEPWLSMIQNFPAETIDAAWRGIPSSWYLGEEDELERLLETLMKRRSLVPQLIHSVREKRTNAFPAWR
jgi:HipA-like protein